jgi:aspartate/methionine/tyrosine aminotransferase
MPLEMMPYIKFATENYITAKFNLARSDVEGPRLENLIDKNEVFHLMKNDSYSLMKKLQSILASLYDVENTNIEFTIGVTNSFFTLVQVMKNLGHKRVLCESPAYEPFWLTPRGCDMEVEFLKRKEEDFTFDLGSLEKKASEGDWLWISNPHNPSGKYLTPIEISKLAKTLKKKKAYLFVDEIYHDFITRLGEDSAVKFGDNVVISSSLTKTYGLGGLKVGWLIGPKFIIDQATISRLHQFMLLPSSSLSVLIPFLDICEKVRQENISKIKKNSEVFHNKLENDRLFFPDFGPIGLYKLGEKIDDIEFSKNASRRYGLVLAPGSFFNYPGHLRLSCAGDFFNVQKSVEILDNLVNK